MEGVLLVYFKPNLYICRKGKNMRLTDRNFKKTGTIEIKSGSIVASDPCYDYGIWCAAEVKAKNGTYDI